MPLELDGISSKVGPAAAAPLPKNDDPLALDALARASSLMNSRRDWTLEKGFKTRGMSVRRDGTTS